ncbi:MAG: alpha/beta fold hydrolase [Rhizomicrobium sp.]
MTMQPVRKLAPMAQGAMSYLEWDLRGPALHFAHATGFNAQTYRSLLSPLADRFHIFAGDARGHGLTVMGTAPGLPSGWTVFRDDLLAFMDDVGGRPMILAGHSMGATVSMMAAILKPGLVRGLVLIEPVFMPQMAWPTSILKRMMAGRGDGPDLAERAARRRDTFPSIDDAFESYSGRGAFATWPEEMLRDYVEGGMALDVKTEHAHLTCAPWWEADTFRSTPQGIARKSRQLKCPVTILHAENGTAQDGEVQTFVHGLPATRVVKVHGATHFLPMEFPAIVHDEINRMADELRPQSLPHTIIAA